MKLDGTYILREVAGETVVIPTDDVSANILIMLNSSGKLLWELLERGAEKSELTAALTEEYEIDSETAQKDADDFIEYLRSRGVKISEE